MPLKSQSAISAQIQSSIESELQVETKSTDLTTRESVRRRKVKTDSSYSEETNIFDQSFARTVLRSQISSRRFKDLSNIKINIMYFPTCTKEMPPKESLKHYAVMSMNSKVLILSLRRHWKNKTHLISLLRIDNSCLCMMSWYQHFMFFVL